MPPDMFHPLVADWFRQTLGGPTGVQERGWRAIAAGEHALLVAPTGSGKTLAAFLSALDSLVRAALEATLGGLSFDAERCAGALSGGHMLAVEIADHLVREGVPFREAHATVGKLVQKAEITVD